MTWTVIQIKIEKRHTFSRGSARVMKYQKTRPLFTVVDVLRRKPSLKLIKRVYESSVRTMNTTSGQLLLEICRTRGIEFNYSQNISNIFLIVVTLLT